MNLVPPPQVLTFFGAPTVLQTHQTVGLQLKYQKSSVLLAYLACMPDKVTLRDTLAGWLWPDLPSTTARANLRVSLADLTQALRQCAAQEWIHTHRDWLRFEPPASLYTDASLLNSVEPSGLDLPVKDVWLCLARQHQWLAHLHERHLPEDVLHWIGAQRRLFTHEIRTPTTDHQPAVASVSDVAEVMALVVLWIRLQPQAHDGHVLTDEEWERQIQVWAQQLQAEAHALGGVCAGVQDGGLQFVFGLGASQGLLRERALRYARWLPDWQPEGVTVHVGMTWGRLLRQGQRFWGRSWRLAQMLALRADPGQLVADAKSAQGLDTQPWESLGDITLRGWNSPQTLYGVDLPQLVITALPNEQMHAIALVGRSTHMDVLWTQWQNLQSTSASVAIRLTGLAGCGKTRLAYELAKAVEAQGGQLLWLNGWVESRHEAWVTLRSLIRDGLQLQTGEGAAADAMSPQLGDATGKHILRKVLATRQLPQAHRSAVLDALVAHVRSRTSSRMLVVLDDWNWMDGPSLELLRLLYERIGGMFWVLTERTTDAQALPQEAVGLQRLANLDVQPLGMADAVQLLCSVKQTGGGDGLGESSELLQRQAQDARGIPLFILWDALGRTTNLVEQIQALARSTGHHRSVLAVAALLGQRFSMVEWAGLVGEPAAGAAREQALTLGLLVVQHDGTHLAFIHASLREIAQHLLPAQEQRQWCARAAEWMTQHGLWGRAAQFWSDAGQSGNALQAWWRAAQEALSSHDIKAAVGHLDRMADALCDHVGATPVSQTLRIVTHARALVATSGYGHPRVHQMLLALASHTGEEDSGGAELAFARLALLYLGSSSQGRQDGLTYAERLLSAAQTAPMRIMANWAHGNTLWWMGRFDQAAQRLQAVIDEGLTMPIEARMAFFPSDPLVFAAGELAWLYAWQGLDDRSQTYHALSASYADRSPAPQDRCIHHAMAAFLAWNLGRVDALTHHAFAAYAIAEEEAYVLWKGISGFQVQLAVALSGKAPDLSQMSLAAEWVLSGYRAGEPTGQWMGADSLRACGQFEQSLAVCDAILHPNAQQEHRYHLADVWRIRAQCLDGLQHTQDALEAWETAQSMALSAGMHGWLRRWQATVFARNVAP